MVLARPVPSAHVCAPWIPAPRKAGMLTQPGSGNAAWGEVAFHRATCGLCSLCRVGETHRGLQFRPVLKLDSRALCANCRSALWPPPCFASEPGPSLGFAWQKWRKTGFKLVKGNCQGNLNGNDFYSDTPHPFRFGMGAVPSQRHSVSLAREDRSFGKTAKGCSVSFLTRLSLQSQHL